MVKGSCNPTSFLTLEVRFRDAAYNCTRSPGDNLASIAALFRRGGSSFLTTKPSFEEVNERRNQDSPLAGAEMISATVFGVTAVDQSM